MIIFIFLGIVASIFQLTILREFTFSIAKNELALVVAAGFWFLFGGLGSVVGGRLKRLPSSLLAISFSLIFCLSISAIHLVKLLTNFCYYESASLGFSLLSAVFLIGPGSFLIGYSFCTLSRAYLDKHPYTPKTFSRFFAYEAIGFFIGGVLFTFFLSSYSNPFVFSFLPLLFLLLPSGAVKRFSLALAITVVSLTFFTGFKPILKKELKQAEILMRKGSPYGPIILARQSGVESLYVNGSLAASSEDKAWNEEFIHTSLSALSRPKKILYIGTFFSGQVQEILKYNIERLDCLDINPVLSALSRERISQDLKGRVNFIVDDPRSYLRTVEEKYDGIIMSMPAPANLAVNRYFSGEFFELVKRRLKSEGVFSFHIPSKRDILSPLFVKFNSCIINTLDKVFLKRLLIPLDSMIVLAKKGDIAPKDLIDNFSRHNIKTDYFTIYHLIDYLDPGRRSYLENMLNKKVGINTDLNPRGFLYFSLLEQAKFYPNFSLDVKKIKYFGPRILIAIFLVLSLLSLVKKKISVFFNTVVIGFSSIGLTALLFILFQLYSGALFWKMGILVGLFMVGLSSGTHLINLIADKVSLKKTALVCFYFLWAGFLFSLFLGLKYLNQIFYQEFIFYGYSLLGGVLTGCGYPLFTKRLGSYKTDPKVVAAHIYAADLTGAFLGTLTFSILFIPFLGVNSSILILAFLLSLWAIKNVFG